MSNATKEGDHPHVGLAIFATGAMALILAAGLQYLGLTRQLDLLAGKIFLPKGMREPVLLLDSAILWLASAAMAFSIPAVILNIPGLWRRILVWGCTFTLTLAWAPVMILASHEPQIGVAFVAVLWSGFCAMFYTINHVLPVDREGATHHTKDDGEG